MNDSDFYEFINEDSINVALICSVCHGPVKDPRITSCDHLFCKNCIQTWRRTGDATCPTCRRPLSSLAQVNRPLKNMLDELEVKCTICGRTGLKQVDFNNHIQNFCPKADIQCLAFDIGCQWVGPREQSNNHVAQCNYQRMRPVLDRLITEKEHLKSQLNDVIAQNHILQNNPIQTQIMQQTNVTRTRQLRWYQKKKWWVASLCIATVLFIILIILSVVIDIKSNQGTNDDIPTAYSSTLTSNSPTFNRPYGTSSYSRYYYEAIKVNVFITGSYTFVSSSSIDTYGYLYEISFDSCYPSNNLLQSNDDSAGQTQFKLTQRLQSSMKYVLVVTTASSATTGSFLTLASGPGTLNLTLSELETTHSSTLTSNSPTFNRPYSNSSSSRYYYESIQVSVSLTSNYSFTSNTSIGTYGYLYNRNFDPDYPWNNLLTYGYGLGGQSQFKLTQRLQSSMKYVLVVTTVSSATIGSFSILASGTGRVDLALSMTSNYSSALALSSQQYGRANSSMFNFYYEAIRINVSISGNYNIMSKSGIDTYGYLYSYFYPSLPYTYLLQQDDDSGSNKQFLLTMVLRNETTYTMVVTTYYPNVTGVFSIVANGPGSITFFR